MIFAARYCRRTAAQPSASCDGNAAVLRYARGEDQEQVLGRSYVPAEAELLGRLRHPNIVALLGTVWVRAERLFVCEFMDGASLKNRLDALPPAAALTWRERHAIASDVARGLVFLHTVADPPVIHQDVKPANILLGAAPYGSGGCIVAKLADFGISRVVPELAATAAKSYVRTQHMAGTPIYMPQEAMSAGRVKLNRHVRFRRRATGAVDRPAAVRPGNTRAARRCRRPAASALKRHMRELVDPRAAD